MSPRCRFCEGLQNIFKMYAYIFKATLKNTLKNVHTFWVRPPLKTLVILYLIRYIDIDLGIDMYLFKSWLWGHGSSKKNIQEILWRLGEQTGL